MAIHKYCEATGLLVKVLDQIYIFTMENIYQWLGWMADFT